MVIAVKTDMTEMPKCCNDCDLYCDCPAGKSVYNYIEERHERCPLISIHIKK